MNTMLADELLGKVTAELGQQKIAPFDIFSDDEGSTVAESSDHSVHGESVCGRDILVPPPPVGGETFCLPAEGKEATGAIKVHTELSFPEHALACQVSSSANQDEPSALSEHSSGPKVCVDSQTEMSFSDHGLACHVASSAEDMVTHGLTSLAFSSLGAVERCKVTVNSILGDCSCAAAEEPGLSEEPHCEPLNVREMQCAVDRTAACLKRLEGEVNISAGSKGCAGTDDGKHHFQAPEIQSQAGGVQAELYTHLAHTMIGVDGLKVLDVEVGWYENQGHYEVIVTYAGKWNKETANQLHGLILSCDCMADAKFEFFGVARRQGRRKGRR